MDPVLPEELYPGPSYRWRIPRVFTAADHPATPGVKFRHKKRSPLKRGLPNQASMKVDFSAITN